MNVVLIEDEAPAIDKLKHLLEKYDPAIRVVAELRDVSESIAWFREHKEYDLVFSDIELTDGTSFQIFEKVEIEAPVILITAFDAYALEAFRLNSIDYLLKPITFEGLSASMEKVAVLKKQLGGLPSSLPLDQLSKLLNRMQRNYKERFMVKIGDHIRSVKTPKICLFFADGRTVYLLNEEKRKYIIDYKLETLEDMLDPAMFFRVNRSILININYIDDVVIYSNTRLKILPSFPFEKEIIVSREKVQAFKTWLEGTSL